MPTGLVPSASHAPTEERLVQVPAAMLQFRLPAKWVWSSCQGLRHLGDPARWESQAFGFGLAQPWVLVDIGELNQQVEELCLAFKFK